MRACIPPPWHRPKPTNKLGAAHVPPSVGERGRVLPSLLLPCFLLFFTTGCFHRPLSKGREVIAGTPGRKPSSGVQAAACRSKTLYCKVTLLFLLTLCKFHMEIIYGACLFLRSCCMLQFEQQLLQGWIHCE